MPLRAGHFRIVVVPKTCSIVRRPILLYFSVGLLCPSNRISTPMPTGTKAVFANNGLCGCPFRSSMMKRAANKAIPPKAKKYVIFCSISILTFPFCHLLPQNATESLRSGTRNLSHITPKCQFHIPALPGPTTCRRRPALQKQLISAPNAPGG